ncbi:MAG: hypothetical protein HC830_09145 [Bacteroidetes bacterium]|nr:hypothetical protein [Bacteroidota bacterium]
MNRAILIFVKTFCAFFFAAIAITDTYSQINDSTEPTGDTIPDKSLLEKRYNVSDSRLPFTLRKKQPLLFLDTPPNVTRNVEYDPVTNEYKFTEKIGKLDYSLPYSMTPNEYKAYEFQKIKQDNWTQRSKSETIDRRSPLMKSINVGSEAFDKIFGTNTINIVPQGSAELILV